jgi:hypothetical protein
MPQSLLSANSARCSAPGRAVRRRRSTLSGGMSPTWIWMQIAIVIFVLIGMVIAVTKLA